MKILPTVIIGKHATSDDLLNDLKSNGVQFGLPWGEDLIERVDFSHERIEVRLAVLDLCRDLGLDDQCQFADIINAGERKGFTTCTMEEVYEARLDYTNQPLDEFLIAAMKPELLEKDDGNEVVSLLLTLERLSNMGTDPWLRTRCTVITPYEGSGLAPCWNPFHDPSFRQILFKVA